MFKIFTDAEGCKFSVNLANIAYIREIDDETVCIFFGNNERLYVQTTIAQFEGAVA